MRKSFFVLIKVGPLTVDMNHIPAKPLHNSDTVSVHFNHFYCMGIFSIAWEFATTKQALILVNLHISQRGLVLIIISYALIKV